MSHETDMERAKGCGNPRGLGRGVDLSYMDEPQCSRCGWFRSKHSEEMPYDIPEECAGFSYIPEMEPEDVVLDRLHLEHAAMDAGTQGNAEPCTVATVPSEPSVLAYELEPEQQVMDRMQAALEAAWEALRHTNVGEVAR